MTDKVPLVHESRDRVVEGVRGKNRMTQICETTSLSSTLFALELVRDSFSDAEKAPSRATDNKRLCRPEEIA